MLRRGVLPFIKQPGSGLAVFYRESHMIFAITWEAVVIPFDRKERRFRESTQAKKKTWIQLLPPCKNRTNPGWDPGTIQHNPSPDLK